MAKHLPNPKSRFSLLLLLVAGCLTKAQAQTDFRPGYIVRPAGDTVRGEVDYRDAYANARQCRYRSGSSGPGTVFRPSQLRAYGILADGKVYRALALPTGSADTDSLYFLDALAHGAADLYYLRGTERRDHYYVRTAAFPLTELVSKQRRVEEDGKFYMQQQPIYRTTLAQALPGCPVVQAMLPGLLLDERALTRTVVAYNNCLSPPTAAAPSLPSTRRAHLGVLLGFKQTHLALDNGGNTQSFYKNLDFDADTSPIIGLAFNLPLSQLSRKLSLEAELYYEAQHYENRFDTGYIPAYGPVNAFRFDLAYLRLPLLVRYTLPKGRVRPLLEAGPTIAYALKTNNIAYNANLAGAARKEQVFFDNDGFRRLELGIGGGLGLQFEALGGRRATVLARYERSNGFSGFTGYGTPIQRGYLLLTLDLVK